MTTDNPKAGAVIGAVTGVLKSVFEYFSNYDWSTLIDTALWAFVGATVGYLTTGFWKWISRKLKRIK